MLEVVESPGDSVEVRMIGEYDIASIETLAPQVDELLQSPKGSLVVDLSELTFMDTSGVALLIQLANHFQHVEVHDPRPIVRRALAALGLLERFGLEP